MTEPVAAADLARLEELAGKATPGPWEAIQTTWRGKARDHWAVRAPRLGVLPGFMLRHHAIGEADTLPQDNLDAVYIAAASPSVVLDLIARLRRAEAALRGVSRSAHSHGEPKWAGDHRLYEVQLGESQVERIDALVGRKP